MRGAPAALAVGLAACTPAISDDLYMPTPVEDLSLCGADQLQHLIGQPKSVLDGIRFAQPVLILDPDSVVPSGYRPDRLIIELLEYDTITLVTCG